MKRKVLNLRSFLALVFLSVCSFCIFHEVLAKEVRSTVLKPEKAKMITNQCSRQAPEKFETTWTPTEKDISELESQLKAIEKANGDTQRQEQFVKNVKDYYRQYIGLVIDGQKLIYINAFHSDSKQKNFNWKEEPVISCDGGTWFWGILYNPNKKEFFDLVFNGII